MRKNESPANSSGNGEIRIAQPSAASPDYADNPNPLFKPLDPGSHTIRVHGTDVRGADKTYTYYLTVE